MNHPLAKCPTNLAGCGDESARVTGLQVERVCGRFTRGLQPQHDYGGEVGRGGNQVLAGWASAWMGWRRAALG